MSKTYCYTYIIIILAIFSGFFYGDVDVKTLITNIKNAQVEAIKIQYIQECSVFVSRSKDSNKEIVDLYITILNDRKEHIGVRKLVANSLGLFVKEDAIEPLKKYVADFKKDGKGKNIIKYEQEKDVFAEVVSTLGNYGNKMLPYLLELYKDKSTIAIVSEARMVAILGKAGGAKIVDLLIEKANSTEVGVRRTAAYSLSNINIEDEIIQRRISDQFLKMLKDADGQVREIVVKNIGKKIDSSIYKFLLQISEKDPYCLDVIETIEGKQISKTIYPVRESALNSVLVYESEQKERQKPGSKIEILKNEYDLGEIIKGSEAKVTLKFRNTGKEPLNVLSVFTDKMVELKGDFSKCKSIKEGAEGELVISFMPMQREEKQLYIVELNTNDKNNPKVNVKLILNVIRERKQK